MITLDFETYYDPAYSLKKLTTEEYIRDPRFEVIGVGYKVNDQPSQWIDVNDLKFEFLKVLLKDEYLLCHNTAFDGAILKWKFGIEPKFYLDTLSMARPVTGATVGGSLAKLAKKFMLGEKCTMVSQTIGKHRAEFSPTEMQQFSEYCCNDVDITYNLFHVLKQFSTNRELYVIDTMLRMFINPALELDVEALSEHLLKVQAKKEELLLKIDEKIGGRDALMSNPKLAVVLRDLGVEPPTKFNSKGVVTWAFAKTDLAFKALEEHPNPMVQAVVAARLGIRSTLEETRTASFLGIASRGKLPIPLNYYAAHTGRAGGADNINLQNLPRAGTLRQAIKAPADHTIVAGDSSQIEARVVAWLAGQDDLVAAFAAGEDIYSAFASEVYGRPINRKRKDLDGSLPDFVEGFVGKTCILGLGFGMGHKKLRNELKLGKGGGVPVDLPEAETERMVGLYRTKYYKIKQLWYAAQEAMKSVLRGFEAEFGVGVKLKWTQEGIHLPNGMLIRYTNLRQELKDGEVVYLYDSRDGPVKIYGGKIIENVVQALARIIVFDQMCMLSQKLRPLDSEEFIHRVVLTVHDEIVICVPLVIQGPMVATVEYTMKITPPWATGLPITCEVESGPNYAQLA